MALEHLSRHERRWMRSYSRSAAAERPARLTEIPRASWSLALQMSAWSPVKAWESREFLAQLYDAGLHDGRTTVRLSICRVTVRSDGRWDDGLSWDDLMRAKREVGFADTYAIEVYPRDRDIVNVANMRHLWLLESPLTVGWFGPAGLLQR